MTRTRYEINMDPESPNQDAPVSRFVHKLHAFAKAVYKCVSSHAGLALILLLYSFGGAVVFQAIEGPHEFDNVLNVTHQREEVVRRMWNRSVLLSRWDEADFWRVAESELEAYETTLHTAFTQGRYKTNTSQQLWGFWGSLFFCTTIYTTIGKTVRWRGRTVYQLL